VFLVGVTLEDVEALRTRLTEDRTIDIAGVASLSDVENGVVAPGAVDAILLTPRAWRRDGRSPAVDGGPALVESLTRRERDVLGLAADGLSNREIAAALAISEHTVKFHLASIFGKLGASSRTEAVRRGLQLGLVDI
jgi:DNA-binding CsgD family transcriptional regulator